MTHQYNSRFKIVAYTTKPLSTYGLRQRDKGHADLIFKNGLYSIFKIFEYVEDLII